MSGASVSSFSSAHNSTGDGLRPNGLNPGEEDHIFDEPHTIQLGVFGVLYTVSKEQQLTSVKFAFFRLFLDFLQLWLLVVNPSYGWDINAKNRAWQVVSFIQLNAFLSDRGYAFFLAMLYIFVGLLVINVALSVWVAHSFSNNRFEYVWPIQFLRWFGLIFYQVLDVATLTLLLVTLDCNYFNVPKEVKFHNQEFPDIMCWSMPHIIHVAVSIVSIILFCVMATCMVLSEMELNPLTRNYMAIVHTRDEGLGFAIKTILTIMPVLLGSSVKWLAVVYVFFFGLLFYMNVRWVPFIYSTLNYLRCASYGAVLYSSALLVVLAFGPEGSKREQFRRDITLALWIGLAPSALVSAFLCHLRLRHFSIYVFERFRDAEAGANSKAIYRFTDAREVEITARCCRCWIDEDTLEPDAVALSEQIIKAGMMQLPQDPQMIILYSSFLIDVQGSYQSGYTQLQNAKKQNLGLLERFAIFSREQEHTQKASGASSGDAAVDLVSYVEFQRNHRLVVRAHREALLAMRAFWGLLLRTHVDFNNLSKALNKIETTVKAAERAYRNVLVRHASSARLVRLYGKFLETVKFDPWAASKWYTEADRLEEEAEHSKEALQLGGIETLLPQTAGGSDHRGLTALEGLSFICINAQGAIQVASPEAHALLGYGKNELKGKDLGIIMPHPFSERHTAYVRNYIHTGTSTMLGRNLEVVVITKTRQVFPVKLHVTKVSGLNEDSVFLGMMEPLPPSRDDARMWVLGNGVVVAADARFCDWLGFDPADLAGKQLEDIMTDREVVRETVRSWNRAHPGVRQHPSHSRNNGRRSSNLGEVILNAAVNMPSPILPQPQEKSFTATQGLIFGGGGWGGGGGGGGPPEKPAASGAIGWLRRASYVEPGALAAAGAAPHHGGGADGISPMPPPVVLARAGWRHKFWDPLEFDTYIQPSAIGNVKIHSVIIRRCHQRPYMYGGPFALEPDPYYHDMLLVADHKGRILHVTAAMAAALGRTPEAVRAGGLALLVPEPTSILHGPWLQELSNPQPLGEVSSSDPPPHSCRNGVAVSLITNSEQLGRGVKQFRLAVTQRLAEGGGAKIHVVTLSELGLEQALSERRLRLTLDLTGTILAADEATPTELFGADPRVLPGTSISDLLDIFQPDELDALLAAAVVPTPTPGSSSGMPAAPAGAAIPAGGGSGSKGPSQRPSAAHSWSGGAIPGLDIGVGAGSGGSGGSGAGMYGRGGGGDVLEAAAGLFHEARTRRLARALLQLAKRANESPGSSWRVGVRLPPDEQARAELEQLAGILGQEDLQVASQLVGSKTVPAVMTVRFVRQKPPPEPEPPTSGGPYSSSNGPSRNNHPSPGPAPGSLHRDSSSGFIIGGGAGGGGGGGASGGPQHVLFREGESIHGPDNRGRYQRTQGGGVSGGVTAGRDSHNGYGPVGGVSPMPAPRLLIRSGESIGQGDPRTRFLLPSPAVVGIRSPVRLDAVFGDGGGAGGGDRRPHLEHQVSLAPGGQGVWGPVMKAPVSDADRPWLLPGGAPGGGRSSRGPAMGPVAEATERPAAARPGGGGGGGSTGSGSGSGSGGGGGGGARGTSSDRMSLDAEDEAVLEHIASTIGDMPSLIALSPPLKSSYSSPLAGTAALSAAVAAIVERTNSDRGTAPQQGSGALATQSSGQVSNGNPTSSNSSRTAAAGAAALQRLQLQAPPAAAVAAAQPAMASRSGHPAAAAGPHGVNTAEQALSYASPSPRTSHQIIAPPPTAASSSIGVVAEAVTGSDPPSVRQMNVGGAAAKPMSLRLPPDTTLATPPVAPSPPPAPPPPPLPPSLVLEVELWRADLLSGVVEVDEKGRILRLDSDCPLGQAGLVLGLAPYSAVGRQISELLPIPSGGVTALLQPSAAAATAAADGGMRGALKKRPQHLPRVGPATTMTVRHSSDCCALDVQVKAVRRAGPFGCAYLCLRAKAPTAMQPGFVRWLYHSDPSGLMPRALTGGCCSPQAAPPAVAAAGGSGTGLSACGAPVSKQPTLSRIMSLDVLAAPGSGAAGPFTPTLMPALPPGLGFTPVLADKAAGLLGAGALPSQTAADVAATAGGGVVSGELPSGSAFHSAPPASELVSVTPLRMAAIRSAAAAAAASAAASGGGAANAASMAPSRLSMASIADPLADAFLMDAAPGNGTAPALVGAALAPQAVSEPDMAISSMMSLDTAYDPLRGRAVELSADDVRPRAPSLQGRRSMSLTTAAAVAAAAAGAPGQGAWQSHGQGLASPRQGASLLLPSGEQGYGVPRDASRKGGRLAEVKHNMIHSWMLSSGGDGGKAAAVAAAATGKPPLSDSIGPLADDRYEFTSDVGSGANGAADGLSMDGADGDARSSVDVAPSASVAGPGGLGGGGGGGGAAAAAAASKHGFPAEDGGREGGGTEEVESEAGAVVANYSVGKRFKKLYRVLTSPLAMEPARKLRWRSTGAIAVMISAHTVTFILLLIKLLQQQAAVEDLDSVAHAARRVQEVVIQGRTLDRLYAGGSYVQNLSVFGDPLPVGLSTTYADMQDTAMSLKSLHHGVYLGFRSLRRMPHAHGLRSLWEDPVLNVTFYDDLGGDPNNPNATTASNATAAPTTPSGTRSVMMGLWDAGNHYVAQAVDLVNSGPVFVEQHGGNFTEWSPWRFIRDNGANVIYLAYQATLDALVQVTVEDSRDIYRLQLIVLCLEGGLLCIMACVYMWVVAHKYSHKRHDLYGVFLQIPVGLTRGLANMSLNLESNDEEDDDDNDQLNGADVADGNGGSGGDGDGDAEADGEGVVLTDGAVKAAAFDLSAATTPLAGAVGTKRAVRTDTMAPSLVPQSMTKRRASALSFMVKGMYEDTDSANGSGKGVGAAARLRVLKSMGALMGLVAWRRRSRVAPHPLGTKSKRRLVESHRLAYALVAPFIMWGAAIIAINLVGYFSLEALTAPIATLNVVNVVVVRFHRVVYYALEVAAALSYAVASFFKPILELELDLWKIEYAAMLYGNEVIPNSDSAHFRLAKTGVLFGGFSRPAYLLYHTTDCLAVDPAECQPPNSPYFQITHNGLDLLIKQVFTETESLFQQPPWSSGLNSSEFQFVWATGASDLEGGLRRMSDMFLYEVLNSYRNVIIQQIVMFCVAWVWAFLFLVVQLRPVVPRAQSEMRRIAELLSQLPPEVECEALVTNVILGDRAHTHTHTHTHTHAGWGGGGATTLGGAMGRNSGSGKSVHVSEAGVVPSTVGARRRSSFGAGALKKVSSELGGRE